MTRSNGPQKRVRYRIAVSLFAALSVFVIPASAQESMARGPEMTGMIHDPQTMAEMGVIHELIVNHDRIKRTVTNLPDGIRTVTDSDDPQISEWIKEHVASMNQRVSQKSDPGLPIESPALHSILKNGDKVKTTINTTEKGVLVVQTSTDPEIVVALQQHASEVSDLVRDGMAAMHSAMMAQYGVPSQALDQHHTDVNKMGDQVMGFDHLKTTHHFLLRPDGGLIQVDANDPKDTVSRDEIRQHLAHIADLFATGDFTAPMLIHSQNPPGVPAMTRLKAVIKYHFEQTARGGRVQITTANPDALNAVHEFLRFQIAEHATGDSGKVEKP